ncbi:PhzF family phenazine biosynthesis protein [Actinorugispora endophytica]|uniref:PhzF family phenazine biosynthesis protein n=1 Tax=Actinorugispora endophytica TaxID=1605990 RepID=A0A4R6V4X4_9ACTN|nr:PhzF family phenazine biosynthesis isomerase [Actinorugispora endophytica]TDQ55485.1 PhzF family phenazine biosynthesis protein [Actinorugispora endophytica]
MHRFRVVDAFTDRPFRGNPAAVLVLDQPYDDGWAQRVAAEFNLSETAFVRPADGPGADYELRWFTPVAEVDLCGHATLAAAHALRADGLSGPFRFGSRSGVLTVAERDGVLWLDFPANPPHDHEVPGGLGDALGGTPVWTGYSEVGDYFVEYPDEAAVRGLAPDFGALRRLPGRGVIVTAVADPGSPYDFVSRLFAPNLGIDEDPVTGSAHTALAPYWADRLGRTTLTAFQCSARGGRLVLELPADAPDRVLIGGTAVTVSEGTLHA